MSSTPTGRWTRRTCRASGGRSSRSSTRGCCRGLPGRALLPALRHRPVRPRARAGLRDRRRPVGLRAVPAHQRPVRRQGRAAGLDHDAVDAGVQHRGRRPAGRDLRGWRPTAPRPSSSPSRCSRLRSARAGQVTATFTGAEMERWTYQRPFDLVDWPELDDGTAATSWCSPTTSPPTTAPAWCTSPPPSAPRTSPSAGPTACRWCDPVLPDGHFEESVRLVGGEFFKHADKKLVRRPRGARRAVPAPGLRARLPALLALPHGAALLRPAVLVHPHHPGQGRAARRERADQLVPGQHQVGPVRRLAAQQHRLGAVPRPLLGHAAADLALRGRPGAPGLRRLAGRARRAGRAGPLRARPAPAVRRRRHASLPGATAARHHAPGPRGHRRLVRLRLDAVRPVGLPARGGLGGAVRRAPSRRSSSARRSTRPAAGSTR